MLNGKTAIITGGSRGIGRAVAEKLASQGCNIAVIYLGNKEKAAALCASCEKQYGIKAKSYKCDVADFNEAKETVALIKADFGTAHILVNNAGITRDGISMMMSEEAFDSVIDTNLKGAFNMLRHTLGLFVRNKEGSVINISSVSGLIGNAGQCNYSASKAGLIGLTKSIAKEYAQKGIRANAVAPGFIATDMTEALTDSPLLNMIPLGKIGEASDVADAVSFLASAKYITGEVIRVDGGIAM